MNETAVRPPEAQTIPEQTLARGGGGTNMPAWKTEGAEKEAHCKPQLEWLVHWCVYHLETDETHKHKHARRDGQDQPCRKNPVIQLKLKERGEKECRIKRAAASNKLSAPSGKRIKSAKLTVLAGDLEMVW